MTEYRFRIPGASPDEIIVIDLDEEQTIEEIKKVVLLRSKLNPILYVSLICKGKILPDDLKLSELDINPKKDVLSIMAYQAGGLH
ncbi:MAG: ubiquitin-like protein [Candidatus Helarchaeota archaeon]